MKDYLKTGNSNDTLLDVYNEQLVITGSNIIYLRKKFLKEIEKTACEKHRIISETEELKIDYDCSFLMMNVSLKILHRLLKHHLKNAERKKCAVVSPVWDLTEMILFLHK